MQSSTAHRLLWGLVIVAVGTVFLLNQTGVTDLDIGDIISTFWPVILILVGLQGLLLQQSGGFWWNGITLLAGFYFLGRNLDWFDQDLSDVIRLIGPIAIIIFGISLIFRGNRPKRERRRHEGKEKWNPITPPIPPTPMPPGPPPAPPEWDEFDGSNRKSGEEEPQPSYAPKTPLQTKAPLDPYHSTERMKWGHGAKYGRKGHGWPNADQYDHSRFIGDIHLGQDYWELRPMSISNFIGDTTLDLTKAQIPVGETKIHVSSFIGDVKVYVPNDFNVGLQVVSSCLIGDVKVLDQKRGGLFNQMSVTTPSYADTDKRIVLVVSSLIGDVRVTKVG
ncbi:cell wall-active antibiotics response protein LiaF [Cohnella lupini]|uniref:Cell wall-active antibiotic response 4TMS protein YvqF n=1 Tax=Cohnella lupini TaxID=1294267 RepID=A0A3D9IQ40_9BACL|nr:cell wall-active antibiotics response protein LiaF [Cohnella lupini]RED63894.1 cell wall-active antibiotic response 4TMS protein YvqF [Cohnella lupini]